MYFIKDNIEYRIVASKAIEQFKNSQAFVLNDLIHGKHNFSTTAKEIILLYYDSMFKWVLFTERLLLDHKEKVSSDIIKISLLEAESQYETAATIMRTNPDVFDPLFISAFLEAHRLSFNLFKAEITNKEGVTGLELFSFCVSRLIIYLSNALFTLHEVDTLRFHSNEEPFLSVDKTCITYRRLFGQSILLERFYAYKKHFNIKDEIYIKSYIDSSQLTEGEKEDVNYCINTAFKTEVIKITKIV